MQPRRHKLFGSRQGVTKAAKALPGIGPFRPAVGCPGKGHGKELEPTPLHLVHKVVEECGGIVPSIVTKMVPFQHEVVGREAAQIEGPARRGVNARPYIRA